MGELLLIWTVIN